MKNLVLVLFVLCLVGCNGDRSYIKQHVEKSYPNCEVSQPFEDEHKFLIRDSTGTLYLVDWYVTTPRSITKVFDTKNTATQSVSELGRVEH